MAPTSVLVVANRTASTPQLLDEIGRQARDGARFTLIVPPEDGRAGAEDWTGDTAAELVGRAAGGPVEQIASGADPLAAVHEAVDAGRCDAIILSVPEAHLSRFIHHDLRHRLEHLGMPVTVIPPEPDTPLPGHVRDALPDDWWTARVIPGGGDNANF